METCEELEGAEAKLETWKKLIVTALGLGQPALDKGILPRSQLEIRGRKKLPKVDAGQRPSFAQLAVPTAFAEALRSYFTAAGCEVRLGEHSIGHSVPLTVWQHGTQEHAA